MDRNVIEMWYRIDALQNADQDWSVTIKCIALLHYSVRILESASLTPENFNLSDYP